MGRPVDRRVRRTRHRLKKAILELVRDQPYGTITVQQILDRADVGRSTFYTHFGSKEDLLLDGFRELLLSLGRPPEGASAAGPDRRFGFSRPLLRHFQAQRSFFLTTLTDSTNARVRTTFEAWLAERIRIELKEERPSAARREGGSASLQGRAHGIAAAFLGIATWWLEAHEELSVEEVDAPFRDTVAS